MIKSTSWDGNKNMRLAQKNRGLNFEDVITPILPEGPSAPVYLTPSIMGLYGELSFSMGRLNELMRRLPRAASIEEVFITREAVSSATLEGVSISIEEALAEDLPRAPRAQGTLEGVLSVRQALECARSLMAGQRLPLSRRIVMAAYGALIPLHEIRREIELSKADQLAQETQLEEMSAALEDVLGECKEAPPLLRVGVVYGRFLREAPGGLEVGRLGRVILLLLLLEFRIISGPFLYPSWFFLINREEFIKQCTALRKGGGEGPWLEFLMRILKDSAEDALQCANNLTLFEEDIREAVSEAHTFYRVKDTALQVLDVLFEKPVLSLRDLSDRMGKSYNTALSILMAFENKGWVTRSGGKRNKVFRFEGVLRLLEGTHGTLLTLGSV